MRKKSAFSLIELLAVIGIVAILIALLLPVINKVRPEAIKVQCMSNLRQLLQGEMMYVNDSRGYLTYPNWAVTLQDTHYWSMGWLYTQGQTSDPLNREDVKTGVLFKYVGDVNIYHCPTHFTDDLPPARTDRLSSYLMNGAVCGYGATGDHDAATEIWTPSWKITDWRDPSEQILMWEAEENVDTGVAWNDGASYPRENVLAKRHGHGACIGCFDGHVEWMDRIDFITEYQKPGPNRLYCDPHREDGGQNAF